MKTTPHVEAGVALLRVIVAVLIALLHGRHKVVQGWAHLTTGSDWPLVSETIQLGFPMPVVFSTAAALIQALGGLLLAAGMYTRPAAALVSTTLCWAAVFNLQTGGAAAELAGLYALVTATFAIIGGGRWSVDYYWTVKRRNDYPPYVGLIDRASDIRCHVIEVSAGAGGGRVRGEDGL